MADLAEIGKQMTPEQRAYYAKKLEEWLQKQIAEFKRGWDERHSDQSVISPISDEFKNKIEMVKFQGQRGEDNHENLRITAESMQEAVKIASESSNKSNKAFIISLLAAAAGVISAIFTAMTYFQG